MSPKKGNATQKLKNLLTTGAIGDDTPEDRGSNADEELYIEDIVETDEVCIDEPTEEPATEPVAKKACGKPATAEQTAEIAELKNEIAGLRSMIASMEEKNSSYMTSKEQFKGYQDIINRRDAETANNKLFNMLTQLSAMREDFFKLCHDMETKIDRFAAKDVLGSFTAYEIDMENILNDCGVFIGKFEYDKLNTIHQRIVDVIPTGDESKNGMVAERISDGYKYNGRVLLKEKVKIYKFTEVAENKEKEE